MLDLLRAAGGADCVIDAGDFGVERARAVVAPRTSEAAAALIALAGREGWSVRCAGAGTRLGAGAAEPAADLLITTARMNALTEYEPADLVMTVQAGVTLAQIAAQATPHRQFLALDPPGAAAATLGGIVACGTAGPLRLAHGTPRDQVLGLEVVTGDARVLRFGGRVVKNVAGYDVVRPLVGSRGTLGLITQISVRLKPLPETDRTLVIDAASLDDALELVGRVHTERVEVAALEILSPALSGLAGATGWTVLARVQGNAAAARAELDRLTGLLAGRAAKTAAGADAWQTLAREEAAAPVNVRLADLPSALPATAAAALRLGDHALADARLAIHAGNGIVRLLASAAAPSFEELATGERAALAKRGGTLFVEAMPRPCAMDVFGPLAGRALMEGVRRVFDPDGRLAGSFLS